MRATYLRCNERLERTGEKREFCTGYNVIAFVETDFFLKEFNNHLYFYDNNIKKDYISIRRHSIFINTFVFFSLNYLPYLVSFTIKYKISVNITHYSS